MLNPLADHRGKAPFLAWIGKRLLPWRSGVLTRRRSGQRFTIYRWYSETEREIEIVSQAANALNVPAITTLVTSIVLFLPNVFVALLIVLIGMALARFVADLVRGAAAGAGAGGANFLAGLARWAILAFAFILALNQLNISPNIIETLFAAVAFGLSLALAIAFGLGGRDTAKSIVDSTYRSLSGREPGEPTTATTTTTPRPLPPA